MLNWLAQRRYSPIGIDVGARSIKLVQFTGDRSRLVEAARVELAPLPEQATPEQQAARISEGLRRGLQGREFHGREVVPLRRSRPQRYMRPMPHPIHHRVAHRPNPRSRSSQ